MTKKPQTPEVVLEITPAKVIQIIYQFREGRAGSVELHGLIDGLNDDERAHLTAIAWVGRGVFEPEEYDEALRVVRAESTVPTEAYLLGMPHLSENLEAGLEALGIDVTYEEEDLL